MSVKDYYIQKITLCIFLIFQLHVQYLYSRAVCYIDAHKFTALPLFDSNVNMMKGH